MHSLMSHQKSSIFPFSFYIFSISISHSNFVSLPFFLIKLLYNSFLLFLIDTIVSLVWIILLKFQGVSICNFVLADIQIFQLAVLCCLSLLCIHWVILTFSWCCSCWHFHSHSHLTMIYYQSYLHLIMVFIGS